MRRRLAAFVFLATLAAARPAGAQPHGPGGPGPGRPERPIRTLEEIQKDYDTFAPQERDFWNYQAEVAAEERDIMALYGKAQEAREVAMKAGADKGAPEAAELKKKADDLEADLKVRIEKHQGRRTEFDKRRNAQMQKLIGILQDLEALEEKSRDVKVTTYKLKFLAGAGAFSDIVEDAALLYDRIPDDRDARWVYATTQMVLPFNPRDRRHPDPLPPCFDKAYALLAPLAKTEDKNDEVRLLFGVSASALGKDAEAAVFLEGIANVWSLRPSVRYLVGPADPELALKTWRDCARKLAEKPDDVEARRERAEMLLRVNAASLAVRDAALALKTKPDDRSLTLLLARAYSQSNEYDKAVPLFKDAVAAVESDDQARAEYGLTLFSSNQPAQAKVELAKLKDRSKLPQQLQQMLIQAQGASLDGPWAAELKAREEDAKRDDNPRVLLETERGKITWELFEDTAPNTVANIVWLVSNGFYDGVRFHRIIGGFMAQGGDPTGTGLGGPGYCIKDEVKGNPRLHWRGSLSMAKAAPPDTGGSQFFTCYAPTPHLNNVHTVFGRVIEGQDVADRLERGDRIVKATVVRKRAHDYKPETKEQLGHTPWKPGEPREGDRLPDKKPEDSKAPDPKAPDAKPEDAKKPDSK